MEPFTYNRYISFINSSPSTKSSWKEFTAILIPTALAIMHASISYAGIFSGIIGSGIFQNNRMSSGALNTKILKINPTY